MGHNQSGGALAATVYPPTDPIQGNILVCKKATTVEANLKVKKKKRMIEYHQDQLRTIFFEKKKWVG